MVHFNGYEICKQAVSVKPPVVFYGYPAGLLEGITALIEIKFGERGIKIPSEIKSIHDAGRLWKINDAIKAGLNVQEIEKMIRTRSRLPVHSCRFFSANLCNP